MIGAFFLLLLVFLVELLVSISRRPTKARVQSSQKSSGSSGEHNAKR